MEKYKTYLIKSAETGGSYFTDNKPVVFEMEEAFYVEITIPEEILDVQCTDIFMIRTRNQLFNSFVEYDDIGNCVRYYYRGMKGEIHEGLCEMEILEKVEG